MEQKCTIKQRLKHAALCFSALLFLSGCVSKNSVIEPTIIYFPQEQQFQEMPSAFEPLSADERAQDWGRELVIAENFAKELDLYRAITAYKRALILLPENDIVRRQQIEYGIILSYYLGRKFPEAIEFFESSSVSNAGPNFPVFRELAIILEDAYREDCRYERAEMLLKIIDVYDQDTGQNIRLGNAIRDADFCEIAPFEKADLSEFLCCYQQEALSIRKAEILNAILPGAGYFYVGQPRAGFTALIVNSLTIAAAYYCFEHGNVPAGILLASLETGWYLGGINGAGLAAKQYNECLYQQYGKDYMVRNRLFPILMLHYSF